MVCGRARKRQPDSARGPEFGSQKRRPRRHPAGRGRAFIAFQYDCIGMARVALGEPKAG